MVNTSNDFRVKEVADMLGLPLQTTYTYIRNGKLASYKVGRQVFITRQAVQEFLIKSNIRGN